MTPAERKYKLAVFECILENEYPSATAIYRRLGRPQPGNRSMNGRECRWREQVFALLFWRYVGTYETVASATGYPTDARRLRSWKPPIPQEA